VVSFYRRKSPMKENEKPLDLSEIIQEREEAEKLLLQLRDYL